MDDGVRCWRRRFRRSGHAILNKLTGMLIKRIPDIAMRLAGRSRHSVEPTRVRHELVVATMTMRLGAVVALAVLTAVGCSRPNRPALPSAASEAVEWHRLRARVAFGGIGSPGLGFRRPVRRGGTRTEWGPAAGNDGELHRLLCNAPEGF